MLLVKICALLLCGTACCLALGDIVDYKLCERNDCTIHEVRVEPCPQAASHTACHIRRRKPASMSFDYTPHFDADTLEAGLSWVKSADEDLPLVTMEKEACKYTPCPATNGTKQTYETGVPIEKKFPLNAYTIRWSLTAPTGQQCCFTIDIKVVR